jgi:hypothetical protein
MSNSYLKSTLLEVVDNQIRENNPLITKKTFRRLQEMGYTAQPIKEKIAAVHIYQRLGYKTVRENDEDYIMMRELKEEAQALGIALGMCFGVAIGTAVGAATDNIGL